MKCIYFLVIACFNVTLFFVFKAGFAQSKVKDGSVAGSSANALAGALLELESIERGFLLPRLTTQQRNAIVPSKLTKGLIIFNTTSECIDYWSVEKGRWLSLCGQLVAVIDTLQCSKVVINGVYKRGKVLSNDNYLSVAVTVSQPGNYVISATTTNGYSFSGNGSFAANGEYTVDLVGTGSPNGVTPEGGLGDEVTIAVNGIHSNCKPYIKVAAADVAYEMTCNTFVVNGRYMIGVPLTTDNTLTLPVSVKEPGAYFIESDTVNGYHFARSGNFTTTGEQTVILKGTGIPVAAGKNIFTLTSNSALSDNCSGLTVSIPAVAYTMNCKEAVMKGTYMQNVALTTDNNLILPVTVTATGPYSITTDSQNGMTFVANGVFKDTGLHQVVLTGTGTPSASGTSNFTITGNYTNKCSPVSVPVNAQPVTYMLNCSSVKVNGTYYAGAALTAAHTISLSVNVTYGGTYTITTNTVNGISFSSTGTFTAGANDVTLTGNGVPLKNGSYTFTVNTNSDGGANKCLATVNIQLRTIRVLGLGGGDYQPGSAGYDRTARAVLATSNFGPNGRVVVNNLSITNGGEPWNNYLQNYISQADIIVMCYNYDPDADARALLIDFVKNKKGVILNFNDGDNSSSSNLANALYGTNSVSRSWGDGGGSTYQLANLDDPVLNGPFGDLRGKYWGQDGSATDFLSGLPDNETIVYSRGNATTGSGNGGVSSYRHATLGYLWAADGGFLLGDGNSTDRYNWPAKIDAYNNPVPKFYGDSRYGGPVDVYNSAFYANAMAWAIQYILKNRS